MKFICDRCNYKTTIKSNLTRHNKSVSHLQLLKQDNVCNEEKKPYDCKCGKQFAYASGLSKHKKVCKSNEVVELKGQVAELISEVESLKKDTRIADLLQELINKNTQLVPHIPVQGQTINNNNNTYKISVKNYVQTNYPDAPPLAAPTDYAKLTYNNQELIDTLLYYYRHKSLHKHLGDFIVGYYKKDDPALQSLWTSDVSRLTYIVKESLAGKESIWNHDPKGIRTKKFIINPMLEHIRKYLNEYWDENIVKDNNKKKGKNINVEALEKRQQIYNNIHAIRLDIDNGILADEIIKYIASDLHIDMSNKDNKLGLKAVKKVI